jgi:hypothetical protein
MIHIRHNDPEGPNEWWLRNIARIQRENPNYCREKNAVFRTHRCRENEDEEILNVRHPTRGYMVQDVCKMCRQRGRTSMRRGRDSDDDDDSDDDEPMFQNRRQRGLQQGEAILMPGFLNDARNAQVEMVRDEDPRARMRAERLAAIERRAAAAAPAPAPAPVLTLAEARRRSLRRSMDERRERARRQIQGLDQKPERRRDSKYTRFGGMMLFSNQSKATPSKKKKKKNSSTKNSNSHKNRRH